MSHAFILKPDYELSKKYGYLNLGTIQASVTFTGDKVTIEIDKVKTREQREAIERGFKALVKIYNIENYYDTLLYICLIESEQADFEFEHIQDSYLNSKRVKELAQLILLFRPTSRHHPNFMKVTSATQTVNITTPALVNWIGKSIQQSLEELNFSVGELGVEAFRFTEDKDGNLLTGAPLNYPVIESFAKETIRKPGIRERNKVLVKFLSNVLVFISNETSLTAKEGVRFSDDQLNFLFKVAELFEWLNERSFQSDSKDYMYTLLSNKIRS